MREAYRVPFFLPRKMPSYAGLTRVSIFNGACL